MSASTEQTQTYCTCCDLTMTPDQAGDWIACPNAKDACSDCCPCCGN